MLATRWMRGASRTLPTLLTALVFCAASASGQYRVDLVPVPVPFDAGIDTTVNGRNDHPVLPECAGVGVDPTFALCSGAAPSPGHRCNPLTGETLPGVPDCPGSCDVVGAAHDGITAADLPNPDKVVAKGQCQMRGSARGTQFQAKWSFQGAGPDGRDFSLVDTDQNQTADRDPLGVCDTPLDPNTGDRAPCSRDRDCDFTRDGGPNLGACLSGDEYWVRGVFLLGANRDDGLPGTPREHQECASDCMASVFLTGTGISLGCSVGTCTGSGPRAGLACGSGVMTDLVGTCPDGVGGFDPCTSDLATFGGADPDVAQQDEITLAVPLGPPLGDAEITVHCPFTISLAFPSEVRRGRGQVREMLSIAGAVLPATVPVELKACYVHDQAGDVETLHPGGHPDPNAPYGQMSHTLGLGVYAPPLLESAYATPCPSQTVAINQFTLPGEPLQINRPVSPILAVTGLPAGRQRCEDDSRCRGGTCVGGVCVDN